MQNPRFTHHLSSFHAGAASAVPLFSLCECDNGPIPCHKCAGEWEPLVLNAVQPVSEYPEELDWQFNELKESDHGWF